MNYKYMPFLAGGVQS